MTSKVFTFRTPVQTPIGPGYVDAVLLGQGEDMYLVTHARSDFVADEWLKLNSLNGPTICRPYHVNDLVKLEKPPKVVNNFRGRPVPMSEVIATAGTAKSVDKTKQPLSQVRRDAHLQSIEVTVGSVYVTNRKGDRYKVIGVGDTTVRLDWLDGKYTRDVTKASLATNYRLEEVRDETAND